MKGGFIKNFVIIGIILAVVFLSQQMDLLGRGKTFTFISDALNKAQEYASIGTGWLTDRAFPNIGGEVQKRGEMVAQGVTETVNEQKQKVSESISEKIKNYFSGITESIMRPGAPQNCPAPVPADTYYSY